MRRSQEALGRHFDADTARELDALIEGLTIHRALGTRSGDDRELTPRRHPPHHRGRPVGPE
ncbi:hypothetical protein [Saccharopolyspora gregorii]|uniref:MarR family transcriptional regulator n=1 Tax=Saccharopolyspora gregorii TaxID=33914 RepID=A0ABP6RHR0_9PSEU